MTTSYLIVDGQWGSTGKGLIAGYLALKRNPDTAVCNFGCNAGHTTVLDDGRVVMVQMLPSAIVAPSVKTVLIGPGAIIDPEILASEVEKYADFLKGKNIYIHESAAVIHDVHKEREKSSLNRVSSTCKGVGAAQADKTMRVDGCIAKRCFRHFGDGVEKVSVSEFTDLLLKSDLLQIESAQGLELGINSGGWYPYCTSRDINVHQILSDCGVPYCMDHPEIIVTMRTFPIRVGDAYDKGGEKVGTSGPVYDDQREISWEELGVPFERTTVTKKVRRVFTWSNKNLDKVLKVLCPNHIFLNFVNYLEDNPSFEGKETMKFIKSIEDFAEYPSLVRWIGVGPKIKDVLERGC
ncbi:MAG: adenylosuccinate synthetase [Candidatus Gracilibacteria bacterium]|nr:adenylosuccinate synthetase [Candidatus Gracilibacteria bacterium]